MSLQDHPKLVEALAFLNKGFEEPIPTLGYHSDVRYPYTFRKSENAALCWITEEGILGCNNQSCYAGLSRHPLKLGWEESAIGIGSKLFFGGDAWAKSTHKPTDEEQIMYMDWVLNRSPYASAFILHDAEEAFKEGIVFGDANAPANLMFFGLNTTRYTHEYTNIVRMFCDLVGLGVAENLAFLVGHSVLWDGHKGRVSFRALDSGHCSLSGYSYEPLVSNFMANKSHYLANAYRINSLYHGSDKIFDSSRIGVSLVDKLKSLVSKYNNKSSATSSNPFAQREATVTVGYKDFIKIISEHQDELLPKQLDKAA